MKADLTRDTFDPLNHFSRVLMQQGRVTLDADHNEQVAILLHYIRTLARDLIGPYAAPVENHGFEISWDKDRKDLLISAGRYYVDGILVENDNVDAGYADGYLYMKQADYPLPDDDILHKTIGNSDAKDQAFWMYLDVWERHITRIEHDAIREKALGDADTCTRAKVVWQVKALPIDPSDPAIAAGSNKNLLSMAKTMLEKASVELDTRAQGLKKQPQTNEIVNELQVISDGMDEIASVTKTLAGTGDVQAMLTALTTRFKSLTDQEQQMATQLPANDQKLLRIQARIKILELVIKILGATGTGALNCDAPLDRLTNVPRPALAARVDPGHKTEDACVTPPDSKYRGTENQLYRVEIHQAGTVQAGSPKGTATFKWSRDNGSVAAAWLGSAGNDLQVSRVRGFAAGDWIELSADNAELQGRPGALVKLAKVEGGTLSVDPGSVPTPSPLPWNDKLVNPKVRRWNQSDNETITLVAGAVPVQERGATDFWIDLEDGIQIQFASGGEFGSEYKSGDYWLIPARVATGDIEWPLHAAGGQMVSDFLPPDGIEHHYAPLGFVQWTQKDSAFSVIQSCRCEFNPLSSCLKQQAPTNILDVKPRPIGPPPIAPKKPKKPIVPKPQ